MPYIHTLFNIHKSRTESVHNNHLLRVSKEINCVTLIHPDLKTVNKFYPIYRNIF
jgi:hypothetical protein